MKRPYELALIVYPVAALFIGSAMGVLGSKAPAEVIDKHSGRRLDTNATVGQESRDERGVEFLERIMRFRRENGDYPTSLYNKTTRLFAKDWRLSTCPFARGFRMVSDSLEYDLWAQWEYPQKCVLEISLRAEAMTLHARIDDFFIAEGRYPESLTEIDTSEGWGAYAPWEYCPPTADADGQLIPRGDVRDPDGSLAYFQPVFWFSPGRWSERVK